MTNQQKMHEATIELEFIRANMVLLMKQIRAVSEKLGPETAK